MKYIVMECHDNYVILMDETANFVKARNLGYEVGQTIENPVLIRETDKYKSMIMTFVASAATIAACLIIIFSLGIHKNISDDNDNEGYNGATTLINDNAGGIVTPKPDNDYSGGDGNGSIISTGNTTPTGSNTPTDSTISTGVSKPTDGDVEWDILLEEEVKSIVLSHTKLDIKDVVFESIEYDIDDGREVFEVEFKTSTQEYEYEIDAHTGQIIKYEVE